mgnify:CR=1 FL=1
MSNTRIAAYHNYEGQTLIVYPDGENVCIETYQNGPSDRPGLTSFCSMTVEDWEEFVEVANEAIHRQTIKGIS